MSLFLAIFLLLPTSFAFSGEGPKINSLIEIAKKNNPAIKAAEEKLKSSKYNILVSKALPDPLFKYTDFIESIETKTGPQKSQYFISQKLPFPGKLSLKGRIQKTETSSLKQSLEKIKRKVITRLKTTYYDLRFVQNTLEIARQEKSIIESMEKTAFAKYEVSLRPQSDVLKIQVELSKIIVKISSLKQKRNSLISRIKKLISSDAETEVSFEDNPPLPKTLPLNKLYTLATNQNPDLKIMDLSQKKASYTESLARKDYLPDFNFAINYIDIGEGKDALAASIGINIPLWLGKKAHKLNAAKAITKSADFSYESKKDDIKFQIEDLAYKLMSLKEIVSLYNNAILHQTEENFKAASADYETGAIDLISWLESERAFLKTKVFYHKIISDYFKNYALLEEIVGEIKEKEDE
jgi:outer membrane protein, heavy metal efflux system